MNNLLVLGSSGLLGSELTSGQYLGKYNIISQSLGSETDYNLDLQDYDNLVKMIQEVKPEIIINLVGITDVDRCEKFPNEAYALNIKTVENLVNAIKNFCSDAFLVHISTDQVYDSEGVVSEENVNLSNYYAFSKYCGELIASQTSCTILRTNFFGKSKTSKRNSFTDWLLDQSILKKDINVFEDVLFNPLCMNSLCKMIELVVQKKIQGIFNLGSHEGMSKADFSFYFAKVLNLTTSNMSKATVSNNKFLTAYRPKNMIMDLTMFENKFKVKLPKLKDEIVLASKQYLK